MTSCDAIYGPGIRAFERRQQVAPGHLRRILSCLTTFLADTALHLPGAIHLPANTKEEVSPSIE